jgi:hypothetical protein
MDFIHSPVCIGKAQPAGSAKAAHNVVRKEWVAADDHRCDGLCLSARA